MLGEAAGTRYQAARGMGPMVAKCLSAEKTQGAEGTTNPRAQHKTAASAATVGCAVDVHVCRPPVLSARPPACLSVCPSVPPPGPCCSTHFL